MVPERPRHSNYDFMYHIHYIYIYTLFLLYQENTYLTEDTCCQVDSHRDLLHGGDRPDDPGCRNRSVQTGNRSSYTCDTGARRQVKVQKLPALKTAPPVDLGGKRTDDAISKHTVEI